MTFAEIDDVDVNRSAPSLDDADGLWPMVMELMELMVMELFTKIADLRAAACDATADAPLASLH